MLSYCEGFEAATPTLGGAAQKTRYRLLPDAADFVKNQGVEFNLAAG